MYQRKSPNSLCRISKSSLHKGAGLWCIVCTKGFGLVDTVLGEEQPRVVSCHAQSYPENLTQSSMFSTVLDDAICLASSHTHICTVVEESVLQ